MTSKQCRSLPQLNGDIYLTEGGIETYIMYKKGFELQNFSLFHLLNDDVAAAEIKEYLRKVMAVAERNDVGLIMCGPLYRASRDWGDLLGYSTEELAAVNHRCIEMFEELASESKLARDRILFSGVVGPRGDAYNLNTSITADEAEAYHSEQIATLDRAGADFITGLTLNSAEEAIGIARAAKAVGIPVVISFTLDKQGELRPGQTLRKAIAHVDDATESAPAYYMINCTHPIDFAPAFEPGDWTKRLGGIRPNASSLAKGVLCKLGHLEEGDPAELGQQMAELARRYPHLSVWGGCCGTDDAHLDEICRSVRAVREQTSEPIALAG